MRCKEGGVLCGTDLSAVLLADIPVGQSGTDMSAIKIGGFNVCPTRVRLLEAVAVIVEELAPPALVDKYNQINNDNEADARDNTDIQTVKFQ